MRAGTWAFFVLAMKSHGKKNTYILISHLLLGPENVLLRGTGSKYCHCKANEDGKFDKAAHHDVIVYSEKISFEDRKI